jgi:hypothetical protein
MLSVSHKKPRDYRMATRVCAHIEYKRFEYLGSGFRLINSEMPITINYITKVENC